MRERARGHGRALLGALLCATVVLALPRLMDAEGSGHPPTPVSVTFDQSHPGPPVPPDFLGLSFELSSLQQVAAYANTGDLVTMLRSLGGGELRFGGGTADTRVAWTDRHTPRPAWATWVVDADDLRQLAKLAAASGWHIVLTIGLGHYEPQAAAREAAAAKAELAGWLEGIELGNEPNAFAQHGLRPEPWAFVQYDAEVSAYRSAIEAAAPGIPLIGPDVSGSVVFESWGLGEAVDQHPAELTGHHYPLGCRQTPPPSITRLLSPQVARKEGDSLRRYMAIAQASNLPFRLDETNSVSCGGTAGISNTFASALWAVGYLTQAMTMGVAGINLHGNPGNCNGYAPVCAPGANGLANGALVAQPDWYALLLAKALLGSRPLPTVISPPGRSNLRVTAMLAADGGLRFVIVDDDPPRARKLAVRLRVGGGSRGASVLWLTGPRPGAVSGVLLGGQAVGPDGSWRPSPLPLVRDRRGVITVVVKPSSAALVSVSPAR